MPIRLDNARELGFSSNPLELQLPVANTTKLPHTPTQLSELKHEPLTEMSVTLHTEAGPLKIEIFCEAVPKTAENFLALCASGYFDDCPFHRNIAGFITQTGDGELGNGKGGKSIWGGKFEDEIKPALRHNVRGVVSMANSGPNTNASQFFITYGAHPHLDGLNTVFGKVCFPPILWQRCVGFQERGEWD